MAKYSMGRTGPSLAALLNGTYRGLGITDLPRFLQCHRPNGGDPVAASLIAAADHSAQQVLEIVRRKVLDAGIEPAVTGRLLEGIRQEVEDATAGWIQQSRVA